jgi:transcription antitermination factor NusA-like protein
LQVKLEAMAELNNSLEEDKKLLLSKRDLVKKENCSLKCEVECLTDECQRLHNIEAKLLRHNCIGMEGRFELSVRVKELETERNRYKAKWEERGYKAEEINVLERQVKGLESRIADQKNVIKDPKQRSCVDTEEKKVSY